MKLKEIRNLQDNLHYYRFEANYSDKLSLFVTSDWHYDNPKTKRELLHSHLDEAVRTNAKIIIDGDLLCLMQGKYDPRKSKNAIRQEHNGDNYIDLVINDTAEKLKPYAKNILQINCGNHETSVSQRLETNVIQRLVERINLISGSNIQIGAYTGFIVLSFDSNNGSRKSYKIAYSHGHWGGVISKGTQATMRYSQMFPDADLVCSGHTHDQWHMVIPRYIYNSQKGNFTIKNQDHIKTGTYKEEFEKGNGWAVEKIGMPKVIGSYWVDIHYKQKEDLKRTIRTTTDVI